MQNLGISGALDATQFTSLQCVEDWRGCFAKANKQQKSWAINDGKCLLPCPLFSHIGHIINSNFRWQYIRAYLAA